MTLVVIEPGLFSTVQDRGRPGFRAWGVPPGGAFDQESADLANALLGNTLDAAVLELTLTGGQFEAEAPLALAVVGASMPIRVLRPRGADLSLGPPVAFTLQPGERLAIGRATLGVRAYLAVRGGWSTPVVLGSRSTEVRLRAGDRLPCDPSSTPVRRPAPGGPAEGPVRVVEGPEFDRLLTPDDALAAVYRVRAESDRVGLRLAGPELKTVPEPNRVSTPVGPGAVQVAGGQLIVLGVACGTMGGYPQVFHVVSADLGRTAQLRPSETVGFELTSIDEARRLDAAAREAHRRRCARTALAATEGRTWSRPGRD